MRHSDVLAVPAPSDGMAAGGERGSHVVVIDDEPMIAEVLRIGLESSGCTVSTAANGRVGLDLVRAERPKIVLLDLMMPVQDGWSVLRELQSEPPPRPAVVVISARWGQGERMLARQLGAVEYVMKPFELNEVIGIVRSHAT
jgi:DNA-binding response OmpR family regulator